MSTTDSTTEAPQPTSQAPAPGPTPPKRLTRAYDDKMIGGVCGGIARYANVDATLVRVLAVIGGVITFPLGVFAYLLLWLVMPAH